ncbi:MAG: GTP-binding protein [Aquificaceae bacterium]|nr:GTP-binding protein [Aquificaceae bacterium]
MPVSILVTGFLGSGKTTFILRSFVERYRNKRVGILVNDFGQIGYDRLRFYSESVRAMGVEGVCICCEGEYELLRALENFRDVEVLIFETSGLSDPYPLMKSFEEIGLGTPMVVCLLPADSWSDFCNEPIFKAQLEYGDCAVISRCDLSEDWSSLLEILKDKPTFLCYEGRVEEDFFTFIEGMPPARLLEVERKSAHTVRENFSQMTLNMEGFYSVEEFESFLKNLPPQVIRVKGFLKVLESPLPMGLNWTRKFLSWESSEKPVQTFLNFIGYKDFLLPPLPKAKIPNWSRMIPVGEFDRREGIAYLQGRLVEEVLAVEWLLSQDLKDFFLITCKESFDCPFETKKTFQITPDFDQVYETLQNLKEEKPEKVLIWDIPDAFASYIIKELKTSQIFHVGRHFLLPKASLSLRVDTKEKVEAIALSREIS